MRHITRLTQWYTIAAVVTTILGLSACDQQVDPYPEDEELDALEDDEDDDIDELVDEEQPDAPDGRPVPTGDLAVEVRDPTPITGTSKVCSVYVPNNWRDTILMNNNNNWTQCDAFGASVGATNIQLGCLTDSGINLGGPDSWWSPPGAPWPNCGW
jgi:hypothetical protein